MRRPIKAHLVNRSNRPVYRSKPVTHAILNLNLNSNWSNRPVYQSKPITCNFEFEFEFNRFPPVSGQTGPVNRYRRAAVWPDRSVWLTLVGLLTNFSLHILRVDPKRSDSYLIQFYILFFYFLIISKLNISKFRVVKCIRIFKLIYVDGLNIFA